ncbi:MAG: hypothetical protein NVS2B9_17920 [Myxococcales bacterium]
MGSAGSSGSTAAADSASMRQVTGQVAKVDQTANSITLDQASGGLTLTVDQNTKVQRNGKATLGLSSIREGEQVRASFDPSSNRADSIEIMGRHKGHKKHSATGGAAGASGSSGSMKGSTDAAPDKGASPSDAAPTTPPAPK